MHLNEYKRKRAAEQNLLASVVSNAVWSVNAGRTTNEDLVRTVKQAVEFYEDRLRAINKARRRYQLGEAA